MKKTFDRIRHWNHSYLLLAFLVPLMLLWMIFISFRVYPFGSNSVLVLDLNGQYVYFFEGFRSIVRGGGSLLYSWSRSLGGEFMGIFAYYLSSPFSLIAALFPDHHITEALLTIILLKVGSIGATCAYYLRKSLGCDKLKAVIFSTIFAVSSYVIVYGHNLMWLDALIWLPLITFGLEELIKKRRFKLFVVSLAMGVICNFYIGYMLCIYVVIYSIYYYVAKSENGENNFWGEKKHFIKTFARVAGCSLIAVSLAAWIILPTYYSLTFGKTTFSNPNFEFKQKFDFIPFLSKMLYGSYDTVRPEGLPVMFCSVLTLLLAPLYFLAPKVKKREKVMGAVLIAVFVLSFNSSTIDLFWHGLQRPNWLNYRYSFMLIFILIVFACKAFDVLKDIDMRSLAGVAVMWALIIFLIQRDGFEWINDLDNVWATLALILIFTIILYAIKNEWLGRGSILILAVVVCVEMFTSGLLNAGALDDDVVISSRSSYENYIERYEDIVGRIKEGDEGFYRMEKTNHRKTNDPFSFGYYGLSNSTSTLNAKQIEFLNQMGYSSKSHWSKYLGGTPVSDSLLGIKYVIYENRNPRELSNLVYSDEDNNAYAYLNQYALSVAFAANGSMSDFDPAAYETPFEYMNALIGYLLGEGSPTPVFVKAEVTGTETENLDSTFISAHRKYVPHDPDEAARVVYTVDTEPGKTLYCFFPSDYPREVSLMADGRSAGTFFANETDRIVELGRFDSDSIKVSVMLSDDSLYVSERSDFYFAYIDNDLFDEVFVRLEKGNLNITEHSDTRLFGNIDVPEGMDTLFTSIPYDACWQVSVDGERVETREVADCLLAAEITPGSHSVELKYVSRPFNIGCIITACGAVVFVVCVIAADRLRERRNRIWRERGK